MVIEFDVVPIVNFENFEWDAIDMELAFERLRENALGLAGKICYFRSVVTWVPSRARSWVLLSKFVFKSIW
jgi:hypothetical protein